MTFYSLKSTSSQDSLLLTKSNYLFNNDIQFDRSQPRKLSIIGSDSYKRSLRRAFTRAKLLAFFNPDLTQFITLTYKSNEQNYNKVIDDIKLLIKNHNNNIQKQSKQKNYSLIDRDYRNRQLELSTFPQAEHHLATEPEIAPELLNDPRRSRDCGNVDNSGQVVKPSHNHNQLKESQTSETNPLKYIYVMELQKRGAIHVHMIANEALKYEVNKNGYLSVAGWSHGFSSVFTIKDFDSNFRPYLYLFKYMAKAQRVGRSFIHVSKNFDKIENVDYDRYINQVSEGVKIHEEDYKFTIKEKDYTISKIYLRKKGETDRQKEIEI